jgi:hypothetical protein
MGKKTKKELEQQLESLGVSLTYSDEKLVEVASGNQGHLLQSVVDLLYDCGLLKSLDYLYPLLVEHLEMDTDTGQPSVTILENAEIGLTPLGDVVRALKCVLEYFEEFMQESNLKNTDYLLFPSSGGLWDIVDESAVLRAAKLTKTDLEYAVEYYQDAQAEDEEVSRKVADEHLQRLIGTLGTEKAIKLLENGQFDEDVPVKEKK